MGKSFGRTESSVAAQASHVQKGEAREAESAWVERRESGARWSRSFRPLVVSWLLGSLLWAAVLGQRRVPIHQLLLDSVAVGGVAWYSGLVSALGILLWAGAVCANAATAFVAFHGGRRRATRVFRGAAVFFSVLLIDDLFLLHSNLLPDVLHISKQFILLAEAGLGALWFFPSWPEIRRTRWLILAAAIACFTMSLLIDTFAWGHGSPGVILVLEDGPKFFGTLALATWAVVTSADVIRSVVHDSAPSSDAVSPEDAISSDESKSS